MTGLMDKTRLTPCDWTGSSRTVLFVVSGKLVISEGKLPKRTWSHLTPLDPPSLLKQDGVNVA